MRVRLRLAQEGLVMCLLCWRLRRRGEVKKRTREVYVCVCAWSIARAGKLSSLCGRMVCCDWYLLFGIVVCSLLAAYLFVCIS